MKIAVRLDDITPDMDWERFFQFKTLLDRYQVKPLIGVVPDNRDENLKKQSGGKPEDFWDYVKDLEKDGWTLAMHGVHHLYTTGKGGIFPLNDFSEFAGLPFAQQKEMLSQGKRILEERGIRTEIFMAPAHSYDGNTLKALKDTGFTAITDGFGNRPYFWRGLKFYPISFNLSSTLQKKAGYSTMVVHTDTIDEEDLRRYESYFKNKNAQWISFSEYIGQPAGNRTIFARAKEFLMAKGKYLIVKGRSRSK